MRFNVKEIKELASQHQCEKEGNLFFRERQEGFFRKQEGKFNEWKKKLHTTHLYIVPIPKIHENCHYLRLQCQNQH